MRQYRDRQFIKFAVVLMDESIGRAVPKPRKPIRDKKYLAYIREKPCMFPRCMDKSQSHHVRWGDVPGGGMAGTPDDYRTVPLCRGHHVLAGQYDLEFLTVVSRGDIMQQGWDLLIEWVVARHRAES